MRKTSIYALILTLFVSILPVYAQENIDLPDRVCTKIVENTPDPSVSSIGGEWAVVALARSGYNMPDGYYDSYRQKAAEYINEGNARRYTDYSRITLALSALGYNAAAAVEYLNDFDKVVSQGINGAVYALIALDSKEYNSDLRAKYLEFILEKQHADGGFGLSDDSDIDVTAMTLQALANYSDDENVQNVIRKALQYLDVQNIVTSESASQAVIAMCAIGQSADKYEAELMKYYKDGMFEHEIGGGENIMATEQAACALAALKRYKNGEKFIYDMTDTEQKNGSTSFLDISAGDAKHLEFLKANNVMGGRSESVFDPDNMITRAEFASIAVRALQYKQNIEITDKNSFSDVPSDSWYKSYVATAAKYGLIYGMSESEFAPDENLTREMAMVIMTRICKACGRNISVNDADNILNSYDDKISDWAKNETAFCVKNGYFKNNPIEPQKNITRVETARMLAEILWDD